MKYVNHKNKARHFYVPDDGEDYLSFLQVVLKYTDTVAFSVTPDFNDIDIILSDERYSEMANSFVELEYTDSIHTFDTKEYIIYYKLDENVINFLKQRQGIFDYEYGFYYVEDIEPYFKLEDIVFIGDGEIICDTLTHEDYCGVTKKIYKELD